MTTGNTGLQGFSSLQPAVYPTPVNVVAKATGGNGTASSPWTGWDTQITWSPFTEYRFCPGYFAYATSPNFLQHGIALIGSAGTILQHTGSGNAFLMGAAASVWVGNVRVENLIIAGNASTTNGMLLQGVRGGHFKQIAFLNVSGDCLRCEACVSGIFENIMYRFTFDPIYTPLTSSVTPTNGIHLLARASDGNQSTDLTFIDPVIEGVSGTGIWVDNAWFITVIGGTSESNGGAGGRVEVGCPNVTFLGHDMEANTGSPNFYSGGAGLALIACNFTGLTELASKSCSMSCSFVDITFDAGGRAVVLNSDYTGTLTDNSGLGQYLDFYNVGGSNAIAPSTLFPASYAMHEYDTPGATFTPDVGTYPFQIVRFLDQNLAIANPTGTPRNGQILIFKIHQDSPGGYVVSWDTQYLGVIPPNSLAIGADDYYAFQYSSAGGAHWDLIWCSLYGVPGGAGAGKMDTMTYASTITLDTTAGNLHKTTTVNATGNATINANTAGKAGWEMSVLIINDATSGKTVTFGTNFKSTGTLTGTTSKAAVVSFRSDGSNWYETARATGM